MKNNFYTDGKDYEQYDIAGSTSVITLKRTSWVVTSSTVVFDTKKEALKFISTISFREYWQEVKIWRKDKKWCVSYKHFEEDYEEV